MKIKDKRVLYVFEIFVVILLLLAFGIIAQAQESSDFTYIEYDNSIKITGYVGESGDAIVPSYINNKPVKTIDNSAFANCYRLKSVVLPNTINTIGYSAFYGCGQLSSIVLPDSIIEIAGKAFGECYSLTNISLPSGLTEISSYTFTDCYNLENVNLPSGLIKIGEYAFYNCFSLKYVKLPNTLTNLDSCVFGNCNGLKTISLPSNIKEIPYNAFTGCRNLTDVQLPNGLESIEYQAFLNCTSLTSIVIPDTVTTIGGSALKGCTSLKEMSLPLVNINYYLASIFGEEKDYNCVPIYETHYSPHLIEKKTYYVPNSIEKIVITSGTTITKGYFSSWSMIKTIVLCDGITTIDNDAFASCTNLENINLPSSIATLGTDVFYNCEKLSNISFDENENIFVYDGILYNKNNEIIFVPIDIKGKINIYDGVKKIPYGLFKNRTELSEVIMPNSVTTIGGEAFKGCTSLISVTLSNAIEEIPYYTFEGCTSLYSLYIPSGVSSISLSAFNDCNNLTRITVSDDNENFCSYSGVLYNKSGTGILYVPKNISGGIVIPEGITTLYNIFENCIGITSVQLPKTLTTIKDRAFYGCTSLFRVINNSDLTLNIGSTSSGYVAYYAKIIVNQDGTVNKVAPNSVVSDWIITEDDLLFYKTPQDKYYLSMYCGENETITLPLKYDDKEYELSYFKGSASCIIVPEGFTQLSFAAFERNKSLCQIVLPNSLISIGNQAFDDCENLRSISIGNNVNNIGSFAFGGCDRLKDVYISDLNAWLNIDFGNINSISPLNNGANLYLNGQLVEEIVLPDSFTSINAVMFNNCKSIKKIVISNNVKEICAYAFYGCSNLEEVVLPDGLLSIGKYAFYDCTKLTTINIPNTVKTIGEYAFYNCSSIKEIHIPNSITSIGNYSFNNCYNLNKLTIGINSIPGYIFMYCENLRDVTLEDTVTAIESYAFYFCNNLESIFITKNVTNIGDYAFLGCDNLVNITVDEDNPNYVMYGGLLYTKDYSKIIYVPKNISGTVTLHSNVNDFSFSNCRNLEEVIIPEGIQAIPEDAFASCTNLEKVTIPTSVTSIGKRAFFNCYSLKSIELDDLKVEKEAFWGCTNLNSVIFKGYVKCYDSNMFLDSVNLAHVEMLGFCDILEYSFNNCSIKEIIGGSISYDKKKTTRVFVIKSNSTLPNNYFKDYQALATLYIECPITIEPEAFYKTYGLSEIHINDISTWLNISFPNENYNPLSRAKLYIKDKLFTDLVVPDEITSINYAQFYRYQYLKSVKFGNNVTSIAGYAFYETNIKELVLPNSLETIGWNAFYNAKIETVTIPSSLVRIDGYAFQSCKLLSEVIISDLNAWCNITFENQYSNPLNFARTLVLNGEIQNTLTIPEGITQIPSYAFYNCALKAVTIPSTVTSIGYNAFYNCNHLYKVTNNSDLYLSFGNTNYGYAANYAKILIQNNIAEYRNTSQVKYFEYDNKYIFENRNNVYTLIAYLDNNDTVTLPANVEGYEYSLSYFDGCRHVTIPDGITELSYNAFNGCKTLESIILPDTIEIIETNAFNGCKNLTRLDLPSSIKTIGEAFGDCISLSGVYINDIESWCNIIFNNRFSTPLYYAKNLYLNGELLTVLEYPLDSKINDYAFAFCDSLNSLIVSEDVSTIGREAFWGCKNLKKALIPSSVKTIGYDAFNYCDYLTIYSPENSYTSQYGLNNYINIIPLKEIDITTTDGNAKVSATNFYLPEETIITLNKVENEQIENLKLELGGINAKAYDLICDDESVNNDGSIKIKIRIKIPNGMNSKKIKIYSLNNSNTTYLNHNLDDDYIEIETNMLNKIVIMEYDHIFGDVNGDLEVNNKDLFALFKYLSKLGNSVMMNALDINGDGKVNNKDITRLFQYLSYYNVEIH